MSRQKAKGDGYERELAKFLDRWVYNGKGKIYRAPLSGGGRSFGHGGKADLMGTPHIWVEAKRTERFSPYAAMEQAERGIEGQHSDEMPVVINRRNRMSTSESLVVMRLGDWLPMYRSFLSYMGHQIASEEDVMPKDDGIAIEFIADFDIEDEPQDETVAVSDNRKLTLVVSNGDKE